MKLSDLIKEAVYDIVGYMLPGLVAIPFILLLINCSFNYSSMYSIYIDLANIKLLLKSINLPLTYYFPLLVGAYIIGIFLKYLSIFINNVLKLKLLNNRFFTFIKNPYKKFVKHLKLKDNSTKYDVSLLENNSNILLDKYNITDNSGSNNNGLEKLFSDSSFLKEYARTTSRFNNHNNLTQKYIAKTNLFSSLSTIFLIEFLNALISSIIYALCSCYSMYVYHAYEFKLINILFPIIIPALLFFLFAASYNEFTEHKKLQDKENFFYLLENFFKKEPTI